MYRLVPPLACSHYRTRLVLTQIERRSGPRVVERELSPCASSGGVAVYGWNWQFGILFTN